MNEEIKEYLKNNLKIVELTSSDFDPFISSSYNTIGLKLDGEIISKVDIPKR